MTQEEKDLVLKDLCARLSYGVHVEISWEYSKADVYTSSEYYEFPNIDSLLNIFWDEKCVSIRPYLRPLSSMTEEEKKELFEAINKDMNLLESTLDKEPLFTYHNSRYMGNPIHYELDFLISHHFDYRGLIPMGLALEAPKEMYK